MNDTTIKANRGKRNSISVETVDNKIYFYDEVDPESILEFNKQLRILDTSSIISNQLSGDTNELTPIYIHVCSPGGIVYNGLSALDNITQCKSKTITIIEGLVASSATFLTIAADHRKMHKHSWLLIHQASISAGSVKHEELKDIADNMEFVMNMMREVYKEYTNLPMKKLNEILKRDLYLDAEECKKYGIIDEIIS